MNTKTIFTSSYFLKSVFALSLFILIFISYISYRHSTALSDSTKWVMHTYEVQMKLEQLFSILKDAEGGQRGFIITQNKSFLKTYDGSFAKTKSIFSDLELLMQDSQIQKNKLVLLNKLIDERYTYLENGLKEDPSDSNYMTRLSWNLSDGKKTMDQIRTLINEMTMIEKVHLKQRQQKYSTDISFTPIFTLLLLSFSLIVLIFSYIRINKDFFYLKKSNQKLLLANESMQHAEKIGHFSMWLWDLETDKFKYSDNQYRLFGEAPGSFDPSTENFLKFVHPEDQHVIIRGANEILNENRMSPEFYRIIRKDGQIRYFKSVGKLVINNEGKKTLVGINSDITEQHESNLELEEQNFKLEQSVRELKSFNHVASHDLQEPLRKIQTFLSRIPQSDWDLLSEKGKEYLEKSRLSAQRMRKLIDDLLLFSSTNKSEKVFEKANLNTLLENVKTDMAAVIDEENATIESDELPEIMCIPFQIQQLFNNIIGNSLKYNRAGVDPIIKISCEKIAAGDYPFSKSITAKSYYKISFQDNGMGFEQQYAENIFVLFNRLHTASMFPGTGIGLAICKKIVENHSGHITAEGDLDKGAIFTVYLPQ